METPHSSYAALLSRRQWFRRAGGTAMALAVAPQVSLSREASPTRALRDAGPVRLSSNENPFGPSPSAREAMSAAFDEACRYPYAGATEDLIACIAEREGVTPDHILIGCGSSEILATTGMTYGLNGGELVAADPTYQGMLTYAESVGAYVHRVPLDADLVHDLPAMEQRVTPATRLVFVCNPNNPTATIAPTSALRDFCDTVSRRAVVFVDEAYIDLLDDPAAHTLVDLVHQDHNVIVGRTFSKIHGLAGMRIGYAIARPDIIKRIGAHRMGSPNVLGLRAAIASLEDTTFQTYSRERIAEGRAFVTGVLDELGYRYAASHANFVFYHTGIPIQQYQKMMRDRGVLVARPFPPYLDWCRVSIGTMDELAVFADAARDIKAMG
ncbi:MAG: histidinol-phosphate transaminase [Rhodothermales bacterium]